jgi:hypothetical protein
MPRQKYLQKNFVLSADDKHLVTTACSKYCAYDLRSFNSVNGDGFQQLCQVLLNLGYKYGAAKLPSPSVESLLPDPTSVSRRIKTLATEYRLKLIDILKEDLKETKLIGISSDFWKNSLTSDNYLTINLHYSKNSKLMLFMLDTSIFCGAKTGEAIVRVIKNVLYSYGIDPEEMHIVYLTDNGSNFVSGLKEEVHLRCVCE